MNRRGFTLIEVMVSLAVISIALVGLLGLQHQTLQSVVRASEITKAALLAQELMTQAEIGQFPPLGTTVEISKLSIRTSSPIFAGSKTFNRRRYFPTCARFRSALPTARASAAPSS